MKSLYICHTVYHLLITLTKHDLNKSFDLVLFDTILDRESIASRLLAYKYIGIYFSENHLTDYDNIPFQDYLEIKMFNDWTNIGSYLRKKEISYHLVEDAFDYYRFDHFKEHLSLRQRLFYALPFFSSLAPFGYSKYVKSIEVNDLSVVKKDCRYHKMFELSRYTLFHGLSKEQQLLIKTMFAVENVELEPNAVLVLTQPLFQDRWDSAIRSEAEQLSYYQRIVSEFPNRVIYFKIHPRDEVDYSLLTDFVIFLRRDVPIEVYTLGTKLQFDIGVTHSSTALDYLPCVRKKQFLAPPPNLTIQTDKKAIYVLKYVGALKLLTTLF